MPGLNKSMLAGLLFTLMALFTLSANAVEIYGKESDGMGGYTYTLLSTSWSVYGGTPAGGAAATDVSGGAGTDWEVLVGLSDFGDAETDSQTAGIYGAGALVSGYIGYRVVFDVQAYTWDSYDALGTPAPGSTGYWDAFAVNLNTTGYYWDLVDGGTGSIFDPIVSTDPAGSVVEETGGVLPGSTWAWGGLDYVNNTFESVVGVFDLDLYGLDVDDEVFVSAVLDTASRPESDMNYPSWGCFNAGTGTECPVPQIETPEPSILVLLGLGLLGLGLGRRRTVA